MTADNMRTLESIYPMPKEGSRTRSNPIGWPTFDNLTCGFLLVECALFSPPPTSSSACFHKQTTYFSRQGFGTVGEPASIVGRFTASFFLGRRSLNFIVKKRRVSTDNTHWRLSVLVLIVRAVGAAWSAVPNQRESAGRCSFDLPFIRHINCSTAFPH